MKKNYEIKCPLNDFREIRQKLISMKNISRHTEKQIDIYYKVKNGRIKLRIINDTFGNLIYYSRDESKGKRISKYNISVTKDFIELDLILKTQFKVLISVIKKREIFVLNNIRFHIDNVKSLGKFLEIEIIYEKFSRAKEQLNGLIEMLDLNEKIFIKKSYSDLLLKKK